MTRSAFAVFAFVGAALLAAQPACAQQMRIGVAALVQNDVTQARAAAVQPLSVGASIVRNDQIRTGGDSRTRIVFTDDTNLAIGPNAQVTMDEFVFRDGRNAAEVGIALARGALRFTSGQSGSQAYRLRTPVATIGVRGTQVDVVHLNGRTIVTLISGTAIVSDPGGRSITLTRPGQSVIVTSTTIVAGPPGGGGTGNTCVGGACETGPFAPLTRIAGLGPGAALCGR